MEGHETSAKRFIAKSLTVLIHGYQGSSFDFLKSSNYIRQACRHTEIIVLASISDTMNESI